MTGTDIKHITKAYAKHKQTSHNLNIAIIIAVSIYIISLWGGLAINNNPLIAACHNSEGEAVPQTDYVYYREGDRN